MNRVLLNSSLGLLILYVLADAFGGMSAMARYFDKKAPIEIQKAKVARLYDAGLLSPQEKASRLVGLQIGSIF